MVAITFQTDNFSSVHSSRIGRPTDKGSVLRVMSRWDIMLHIQSSKTYHRSQLRYMLNYSKTSCPLKSVRQEVEVHYKILKSYAKYTKVSLWVRSTDRNSITLLTEHNRSLFTTDPGFERRWMNRCIW